MFVLRDCCVWCYQFGVINAIPFAFRRKLTTASKTKQNIVRTSSNNVQRDKYLFAFGHSDKVHYSAHNETEATHLRGQLREEEARHAAPDGRQNEAKKTSTNELRANSDGARAPLTRCLGCRSRGSFVAKS